MTLALALLAVAVLVLGTGILPSIHGKIALVLGVLVVLVLLGVLTHVGGFR